MGAAQIVAVQTAIRPRPITPTRRGNNPPPKKVPSGVRQPDPVKAGGTTTGNPLALELQKVKAELIELKKQTNQQLLTEVKYLRGQKTELEAQVTQLKADLSRALSLQKELTTT